MSSVVFRPYRRGDDIEINGAFNEIFGQQRSVEEWQWKFLPFENGSRIIVAVDRSDHDKIVAQYSVTTALTQVNGKVITLGQPVDVFSYRKPHLVHGQVFVKAIQALFDRYGNERHCNVLYGFPGKRAYRLGRLAGLYPLMLPVPYFSCPVAHKALPQRSKTHVMREELHQAACDDLWTRACHRYPISVIRTFSYVNRRFISRPNNNYRYLACYREEKLVAWAVYQLTEDSCCLIDLLWDGEEVEVLKEIQESLFHASRQEGVGKLEMWLSNDPKAVSVFTNNGWQQSLQPQELVMGSNSFDDSINAVEFMSRLYFTMADSDLF